MQLSLKIQEQLIEKIRLKFDIDQNKAKSTVKDLKDILNKENQNFFYVLQYTLHFSHKPDFIKDLLSISIEIFSFLLLEYPQNQKELEEIYYRFIHMIFLQRCFYARKLEQRSKSVQNILGHVSDKLESSLKTQELMIANISHEMRTSLNAVSGYLSLIDKEKLSYEKDKNFLKKACTSTEMLKTLVADILDVSKMNSGQLEMKEEPFYLDEIILKCIDNIALGLKDKTIKFIKDIDIVPQKLLGDHYHINEILTNLLSNAIKYTELGTVSLNVELKEENKNSATISFCVEDTGKGISPKELETLFDPYSRFIPEKEGIGLGLHISSRLVERLGGELKVKSTISKGSVFYFVLIIKKFKEENKIDFTNKVLYFFNNQDKKSKLEEKYELFRQWGASVQYCNNEQAFTSHLLDLREKIPDVISINANSEEYIRYDALINYLKSTKRFSKTLFIAEEIGENLSLKYFDKINEYFTPLSTYCDFFNSLKYSKNNQAKKDKINISILAVDDMETNLEVLKLFIAKRFPKAKIDLALGGYEAIGMYKTNSYDIIFLDLKMPGQSGYKVFKKLKKIKNKTLPPVYALTADVYKSTYEDVMEVGFTGLLEKPLQLDILFKCIEKVIK